MNQVRLDQFDNEHYNPGKLLYRVIWYMTSLVIFEAALPFPSKIKRGFLRVFGAKIGKGVIIKPHVRIKYPHNLTVGDYSWIGEGVWIDNLDMVTIGQHCCISQGAYLLCGNHDYTSSKFDLITHPVIMQDGSWAGAQSILGPGAMLEEEAVLTAGSVGLGALSARHIHQGNPARPVRERVIKP